MKGERVGKRRRHRRRGPQLISVPRKEGGERGGGGGTVEGREGVGRGSDLHKYIEFIEMSLGIAARRILAAYQPPRRFIPSSLARATPSLPPFALAPPSRRRPLSHLLRSRGWFMPPDRATKRREEGRFWMRIRASLISTCALVDYRKLRHIGYKLR